MKVPPRNIDAFVKSPPADMLAILVYGPDEGLVRERLSLLSKTVAEDAADPFAVSEFTGAQLSADPSKLLDEAQSISMLGGRRVIRLRDATDGIAPVVAETLKALKPGDNLVLVEAGALGTSSKLRKMFEGAKNAAAVACYVEDERDLMRLLGDQLRGAGFRVSSDALSYMAANVVGDRAVVRSEAEKLMTYMGDKKEVSLEDVEACVGSSAALSLDGLAKSVAGGQYAAAERILQNVMSEGMPGVAVLRNLQYYFLRLHVTKGRMAQGESMDAAIAKLRPPLFFKHKSAFIAQVAGWPLEQIENALVLLQSAEAKCKQTGAADDLLCSRAIMSLSQLGARALRRRAG
ncbi:MAG: DNA polymerase III subunit delta [Alphaproteobacteria bacterium]|nr:DNA polymerase III subunit delta [Alphaproteobacteria bacterium]